MSERAGIYLRISEDPRSTELGIRRQRAECEAMVRARGWELAGAWQDNDVAVLRRGAHRPGYAGLMDAVDRGEVTRIVVYQLSRLWRSRTERAEAIDYLRARHVGVALVKGSDLDLASASGRGYAGLIGEFDTMESEIKAERVASAALERAQAGRASGHVAFGWRRVRERSGTGEVIAWRDEVDPDAAEIVREIVDRLLARETLSGIARDLSARQVPVPRSWLRRANGDASAPLGTWGTGTVRKIAMRPANLGRIVRSRSERDPTAPGGLRRVREDFGPAEAPAIVDRDRHDRVCALLAEAARTTTTRRGAGTPGQARPGARQHLLTYGIGVCGGPGCGSHLRVVTRAGHPMYACDAPTGCTGRRQRWVDELVENVIVERLQRPDALTLFARDDGAREAEARAAAVRARLDGAADDYANGAINREMMRRIAAGLRPQLEELERRAARALHAIAPEQLAEVAGPRGREVWRAMAVTQRRALLTALGVTVTILPARGGPGFKPESVRVDFHDFSADEDVDAQ